MSGRQGGKAKPLKAPKKKQHDEDQDDAAFKAKQKADAAAKKAMAEKAKKGGPMTQSLLITKHIMPLTPVSTPTKKRTIRDISNTYNAKDVQLPLTPTKTPTKKQRLDLQSPSQDEPSCKRKLVFTPTSSPTKPPLTPKSSSSSIFGETSIYSQAKALFQRGSKNGELNNNLQLPSREQEAALINNFISKNLQCNQSNSLYISGPPGTGKTAQVNLSLQKYETSKEVKIVRINCMTLRNPESIFHEIYASLVDQMSISFTKRKTFDDFYQVIDKKNSFKHVVLFLDELDSLLTNNQQVLFKLFQISNSQSKVQTPTKVVLIGISNTLDLNNKFLPKLFTNNMIPESVQFLPYSTTQIKSIIMAKLAKFPTSIFHPVALQFCSQKAASISGDLRKAFDICYKSIELVELEQRGKPKDGDTNVRLVTISHVAKVCADSFSSNTTLASLSVLHKSILCQLFNFQLIKPSITINMFYDYYQKQQQEEQTSNLLGSVKSSEFLEILAMLESNNCITMESQGSKNNNNDNNKKLVKLNIDYDELVKSIEGVGFLKKLLKHSREILVKE
ncbi:CDC6 [Candida margitis]|uniref:CDC6 n=1 Tax=Candida margitis TaxID=1775924 RepID=UPI002226B6F7|nr:CDC6 [Candida margitis]KAI5967584.1 CDC6 [Candida margitis]